MGWYVRVPRPRDLQTAQRGVWHNSYERTEWVHLKSSNPAYQRLRDYFTQHLEKMSDVFFNRNKGLAFGMLSQVALMKTNTSQLRRLRYL